MRNYSFWATLGLTCSLLSSIWAQQPPSAAPAAPTSESAPERGETSEPDTPAALGGEYVRVQRDERDRAVSLDTAIIRYTPSHGDKGVVVDLIGAIHVGEASYYAELNRLFAEYDALLFELVAPEGIQFQEGQKLESSSPVGALQGGLKNLLGLEFQLEKVNYAQPNFVHADMSPEEFARTMKDRGESFFQLMLRLMGQSMAIQGQQKAAGVSDVQVLMAVLRRDRVLLKRLLAEQLEGMEGSLSVLGGPDGGSTIITERNKKALEVLRRELADGKKKIGIFYGAGHLSDFHTRLQEDFQLQPVGKNWLSAWDLTQDHSRSNGRR
jgi:hypothetical protein